MGRFGLLGGGFFLGRLGFLFYGNGLLFGDLRRFLRRSRRFLGSFGLLGSRLFGGSLGFLFYRSGFLLGSPGFLGGGSCLLLGGIGSLRSGHRLLLGCFGSLRGGHRLLLGCLGSLRRSHRLLLGRFGCLYHRRGGLGSLLGGLGSCGSVRIWGRSLFYGLLRSACRGLAGALFRFRHGILPPKRKYNEINKVVPVETGEKWEYPQTLPPV